MRAIRKSRRSAEHLDHEQMRGWYAFDEGGPSGAGNWAKVRSNWHVERNPDGSVKSAMAMPHGWSIAEMQLLLRDALAYEDDGKLILFAGVPEAWFAKPMRIENLPTYFGRLSVSLEPTFEGGLKVILDRESIQPPNGVFVRTPGGGGTRTVIEE